MTDTQRLNKYIAHATGMSRREADAIIEKSRVTVDGKPAVLGVPVSPTQVVAIDGKPISQPQHHTTILLHKPVGYVCSRRQQGDAPTVYDLLPVNYHSLKLVGRLDRESSGIILLTDDGDLAHQLLHPTFGKTKVYHVQLDQPLAPLHQQMISDYGIALQDGPSQFALQPLHYEPQSLQNRVHYQVTMTGGRNRQIRRTFAALGYHVVGLHRVSFGPYSLGSLPVQKYIVAPE